MKPRAITGLGIASALGTGADENLAALKSPPAATGPRPPIASFDASAYQDPPVVEVPGFDPTKVPDPTVDPIKLIEAREAHGKRPGGFGIHLAKRVMDTFSYNETGNIVTMEKRFQ